MGSVPGKIASALGRKDEEPDRELAASLAKKGDALAVRELVGGLGSADRAVQADCIKVLYEIGYIKPELIAPHASAFVRLLGSGNNRLVWGGMIALSTIADRAAAELYGHLDVIWKAVTEGSVITVDAGIKTVAKIAAADARYAKKIVPLLIDHLSRCRPKEVAQHAESAAAAAAPGNRKDFIALLQKRMEHLSASQATRVKKVLKNLETMGD